MKRPLAAGNWKMNGTATDLAEAQAIAQIQAKASCEVLICPPATLLSKVADLGVAVGGQDCHSAGAGAHTGDISAAMLADAGARYVILGHSERRADHGETDALVRAKATAAQAAGLAPIVCVGETLAQREAQETLAVIGAQLDGSLPADATGLVVAYEPVWAIGTGKVPTLDQIAEVHQFMQTRLAEIFGTSAEDIRMLYGGSVKAANAAQIFAVPGVDGALVGGASLKSGDFAGIIAALDAA